MGKGTGIGLSISLGIINYHQGKLSIENDNPNTCFVVEVPLTQNQTRSNLAS